MKVLKTISLAMIAGLLITGCGEKKEEKNIQNTKKNTPYEIDVTIEPLRIYDSNNNLVSEQELNITKGYTVEQSGTIVELEIKDKAEKKYLVVNGKNAGQAIVNVYQFDNNSNECSSRSTMTFKVDENLNVSVRGIDGSYGSCDAKINSVSIIK